MILSYNSIINIAYYACLSASRLKEKKELIVMGYIRRIESTYKELNIILDIKHICFAYYALYEYFADHVDKINVNSLKNIAQGTTDEDSWDIVCGSEIMDISNELIVNMSGCYKFMNMMELRKEYGLDYMI